MFAGVVTYYHWEAMLVSYLSTRITVLPFTTIGEMLKESDYRIGLMPGTIQEDFFKLSPDPMLQQAFKERIEPYLEDYPLGVPYPNLNFFPMGMGIPMPEKNFPWEFPGNFKKFQNEPKYRIFRQ